MEAQHYLFNISRSENEGGLADKSIREI